eukprot:scaffold1028_cov135-Cylindrotheca_fusiformis.AAC.2
MDRDDRKKRAIATDVAFHDWCSSVGIQTPSVRLLTTPTSVAGRGVFATDDMAQGDAAIKIPGDVVLYSLTAASFFPELSTEIERKKKNFRDRKKWWHRLKNRWSGKKYDFTDTSDLWQAELTQYSLACLESKNFWAPWIQQWQRSDPMQKLYEKDISSNDKDSIMECVKELKSNFIPEEGILQIRAAVDIRIRRYEELKDIFDLSSNASTMYGLVTSRAIDLGNDISAVIPMFDMVNHSADPNLVLSFIDETDTFELRARRNIRKGEELFLNYQDESDSDNEFRALWSAVQWGIPGTEASLPVFDNATEAALA